MPKRESPGDGYRRGTLLTQFTRDARVLAAPCAATGCSTATGLSAGGATAGPASRSAIASASLSVGLTALSSAAGAFSTRVTGSSGGIDAARSFLAAGTVSLHSFAGFACLRHPLLGSLHRHMQMFTQSRNLLLRELLDLLILSMLGRIFVAQNILLVVADLPEDERPLKGLTLFLLQLLQLGLLYRHQLI